MAVAPPLRRFCNHTQRNEHYRRSGNYDTCNRQWLGYKADKRLQVIIIFVTAFDALFCIVTPYLVLDTCLNSEHRIDIDPHSLYRARRATVCGIIVI